ncbi:16S rRNA (adenine(1518)-N(6)/adenine(1519)-N(6))-dimethyltransferase RsmA [[Flexibacter] sp. ATCC 35208]|uniref:16S rRNA (adenine(1518)-N(6)/adenine(1519)-N(6))- dimethyltransferase RsmA n=1 Tax=[Flexibacter] sp. ATCC 35208 TaxID=1936242 RepID=UPI0009CE9246|nr:16S rRNA (adenine(1518)-N(6)/adenine(1519)-N(6))-dimethyltransferase RsmA [[Flexibacter] sp. ATCC 35208]OMP77931.1 16S rRNA (adenine(1518)-N(6)/adenine(1519)-N(6))-dimethyltransferase [[Flexibacter] sp. ATCC 35208]
MYTLKKSLGQHFLKDENICRKIVDSLPVIPNQQVLEVGPGAGAITKYLLELPDTSFKAVELDTEKVAYLQKTYPAIQGKLINESFLDVKPPFEGKFNVIGNFPYNISSQIMFRILDWKEQVPCVVGMFQKEVALRIAAKHGNKDYGILSVLIQAYYRVEYLFEVSETCFNPPPKVKSAVIRLHRLEENYDIQNERKFKNLVKTAFGQRRKQLRNPLKTLFDKEVLQDSIFTKRAEELTVADFVALSHKMI